MTKDCDSHDGWFLRCCNKYYLTCIANLGVAGFLDSRNLVEKSSNDANSFLKRDSFE